MIEKLKNLELSCFDNTGTYCKIERNSICDMFHKVNEIVDKVNELERSNKPTKDAEFGKWISVKDRLPEKNVIVLCIVRNLLTGSTALDVLCFSAYGKGFDIPFSAKVTHWMPLPEPPQKEGADNGN